MRQPVRSAEPVSLLGSWLSDSLSWLSVNVPSSLTPTTPGALLISGVRPRYHRPGNDMTKRREYCKVILRVNNPIVCFRVI